MSQQMNLTRNGPHALTPIGTLFERLLGSDALAPFSTRPGLPLAIWQDEHTFYVEIDAPGVKPEDVQLSVHNRDLTVSWERRTEKRDDGVDTRTFGKFEQMLRLPTTADDAKLEANLTHGVLRLTVPKTEQAKPRKIEVKAS
ncbi:MAG: Hsp20/alpha crystallin family protein [Fimbriiglobus sp.]|jgi:HSP20 family protein|nr:Hsp20/alpha crystallin family protein [Fimbriiglobus sp.]